MRIDRATARFIPFLALLLLSLRAEASWTITGTATREDGVTGLTGVKVVLYPGELATQSDDNGDFILPWDGSQGYLTVQAEGSDFCKRLALWPKAKTDADSTMDLGAVTAVRTGRYFGRGKPVFPQGELPPDSLHIAGPAAGQPDRYWMIFRIVTDLYGTPTLVDHYGGDQGPPELQSTIIAWLKGVKWRVNRETLCDLDEPFRTMMPLSYWWVDGQWINLPDAGPSKSRQAQINSATQRINNELLKSGPDSTLGGEEP